MSMKCAVGYLQRIKIIDDNADCSDYPSLNLVYSGYYRGRREKAKQIAGA